jgi:lysozyme
MSQVITDALKLATPLVIQFEGFRAKPYLCPARVWTIGYGTTVYPSGAKVGPSDPACTKEQAQKWLEHVLREFVVGVARVSPGLLTAPANRLAALGSFAYNVGLNAYSRSTLKLLINQGSDAAPDEFAKWVRGGGQILPGLVLRRAAERQMFVSDLKESA